MANDRAKVHSLKVRLLVGENVCLDIAKRGLRFVPQSLIECSDDVLLEVQAAWIRLDHGLTGRFQEFVAPDSQHIHLDAGRDQCNNWMHELRDTWSGVQCYCCPDVINILLRYTMLRQKLSRLIRTIYFK